MSGIYAGLSLRLRCTKYVLVCDGVLCESTEEWHDGRGVGVTFVYFEKSGGSFLALVCKFWEPLCSNVQLDVEGVMKREVC